MYYPGIYEDATASFIKQVTVLASSLATQFSTPVSVIDLDAQPDYQQLPLEDLLAYGGFTMSGDGKLTAFQACVCVTTANDVNLMRHRRLLSKVFDVFQPGERFPLYQTNTVNIKGFLICDDHTSILPIANTQLRPLQIVQVRLTPLSDDLDL